MEDDNCKFRRTFIHNQMHFSKSGRRTRSQKYARENVTVLSCGQNISTFLLQFTFYCSCMRMYNLS